MNRSRRLPLVLFSGNLQVPAPPPAAKWRSRWSPWRQVARVAASGTACSEFANAFQEAPVTGLVPKSLCGLKRRDGVIPDGPKLRSGKLSIGGVRPTRGCLFLVFWCCRSSECARPPLDSRVPQACHSAEDARVNSAEAISSLVPPKSGRFDSGPNGSARWVDSPTKQRQPVHWFRL